MKSPSEGHGKATISDFPVFFPLVTDDRSSSFHSLSYCPRARWVVAAVITSSDSKPSEVAVVCYSRRRFIDSSPTYPPDMMHTRFTVYDPEDLRAKGKKYGMLVLFVYQSNGYPGYCRGLSCRSVALHSSWKRPRLRTAHSMSPKQEER
jgi:hypothetical protein